MKILLINSLYPPYHRGGAEVVVQTLVDELKKDHEVHVLTLQPWKGFSSMKIASTVEGGVRVHRFFSMNIFSFINIERHSFIVRILWHVLDAFNIHSYITTRNLLHQLKPDLVLTHNTKGLGYTVFRAIRNSRIQTIHTVHDVQMIEPSGLIMWGHDEVFKKPSLVQRITIVGSRLLAGSPNRVIFPSQFLKGLYEKYGFFKHSEQEVISNPIPDTFLTKSEGEKSIHTPCRFLILGQVGEHKGIRVAIDALRAVPDLICTLSIVGDGALVEYVKQQALQDTRIQYRGRLDREQVRSILQESDYTVVPSLCYENSPMSIYESMANGTPVIAARIGGVAELVTDGINGYTVTSSDTTELANAFLKATQNGRYEDFSQSARATVQQSVVSKYVQRLLNEY